MAKINWSSDLSVGVAEMDEEHKHLIGLMSALLEMAEAENSTRDKVMTSFKQLISYTEKHFWDEEVLMERAGYSDLAAHKKAHADLMKRLQEEYKKCESQVGWSAVGCMKFFEFWLKTHIRSVDKKYGKVVQRG